MKDILTTVLGVLRGPAAMLSLLVPGSDCGCNSSSNLLSAADTADRWKAVVEACRAAQGNAAATPAASTATPSSAEFVQTTVVWNPSTNPPPATPAVTPAISAAPQQGGWGPMPPGYVQ